MSFTVIIPARYASSRLPGKPLANIAGKTMIERVVEQAKKSKAKSVIVATDDVRIEKIVNGFGGKAIMTSDKHLSGTDRLQEVAHKLGLKDTDIIVNVQGDEPLIPPSVIDQVANNLAINETANVATLCEPILSRADIFNSNIVKIATDLKSFALYFSRASIPWFRDNYENQTNTQELVGQAVRHIGIYAYRVGLLNQFVQWPEAPIEKAEKLEQLRILYNGGRIHVAQAIEDVPGGVDTPDDLTRIQSLFNQ